MEINIDERVACAKQMFASGYNCSQSVFMAYNDVFGLDDDNAFKVSMPFGGGMGGMHNVCGCVSGAFMCTGYLAPNKMMNYTMVRELTKKFEEINGSIICRELLQSGKRPCIEYVATAARLIGEIIQNTK